MAALEAAESAASALAADLSARAALERERREAHEAARAALTGLQLRDGRLAADLEAIGRDRARILDERATAEAEAAVQRRAVAVAGPGPRSRPGSRRHRGRTRTRRRAGRARDAADAHRRRRANSSRPCDGPRPPARPRRRRPAGDWRRRNDAPPRRWPPRRRSRRAGRRSRLAWRPHDGRSRRRLPRRSAAQATREAARVSARDGRSRTRGRPRTERRPRRRRLPACAAGRRAWRSGWRTTSDDRSPARHARPVGVGWTRTWRSTRTCGRRSRRRWPIERGRTSSPRAASPAWRASAVGSSSRSGCPAEVVDRRCRLAALPGRRRRGGWWPAGRRHPPRRDRGRAPPARPGRVAAGPGGAAWRCRRSLPAGWVAVARDGSAVIDDVGVTLGAADTVLERRAEQARVDGRPGPRRGGARDAARRRRGDLGDGGARHGPRWTSPAPRNRG